MVSRLTMIATVQPQQLLQHSFPGAPYGSKTAAQKSGGRKTTQRREDKT